jgi:APA family basic amino acid/polyamine antiporter
MSLLKRLFAQKSLDTLLKEMAGEHRLRRVLGPISLTSLGVGAIIGAGIFVMTGRAAAQDAGPAIMMSYVVAGVACSLAALCYAEFASMAPVAGSAYTYAYATLGELLAWIIGWDLVLEYAMAGSVVAASWTHYFNAFLDSLFGIEVYPWLCADPFSTNGAAWCNLPAFLILVAVTAVLVVGIRESATTNAIMVLVKVGVVLFVIALGVWYIDPANWTSVPVESRLPQAEPERKWGLLAVLGFYDLLSPIDEAVRSPFFPYGLSGVMVGGAIVFFAYIGFDSVSTHSEEARRPQRDVPIAIIASLLLCTVLYMGVAAVITGMVPYPDIDPEAAVARAFSDRAAQDDSPLLRAAAVLIAVGALAGMTSVLLITFLSQARIFLAMARDRLLPPSVFGAVHEHYRTPHISTIITGLAAAVIAALTPITDLEEMVSIGTLMAFAIVCAAVLILRVQRPDAERPFRCPLVYVVAPLGVLVNVGLMLFLPPATWMRLVVWLAAGLAIYFCYGYWHSTLGKELAEQLRHGLSPTDAPVDPHGEDRP